MKELAVSMTHNEYENYKKYLEIKNQPGSILFSYYIGMGCYQKGLKVLNETETISILIEQIEHLRKENLEEITSLETIIAEKNEKIYQLEKRKPSWWRSLWT